MDDLELQERCAKALGYSRVCVNADRVSCLPTFQETKRGLATKANYRPLTNHAQAWVLAKRFPQCMEEALEYLRHEPPNGRDLARLLVIEVAEHQQREEDVARNAALRSEEVTRG